MVAVVENKISKMPGYELVFGRYGEQSLFVSGFNCSYFYRPSSAHDSSGHVLELSPIRKFLHIGGLLETLYNPFFKSPYVWDRLSDTDDCIKPTCLRNCRRCSEFLLSKNR